MYDALFICSRDDAAEASVAKGTSFHVIIIDLAMTGCNARRRRTPSSHHVNKRRWLVLFDAIFSLSFAVFPLLLNI